MGFRPRQKQRKEKMMKRILTVIITIITTIGTSYGVTLCKKTNTAVAILNKVVGGTVDNSTTGHRWQVNMTDTTVVKGKSLCTGMPGDFATVNTGVADTYDTGYHCYCKMMAPATSYWVNASGSSPYATESDCETNCVTVCANYMATNQTFRSAVYEAVW